MCGITGFWQPGGLNAARARISLIELTTPIAHRGPDDAGTWINEDEGIALGHRRLSILDLSSEGHQPMVSESGRFVISYNGEIYNFAALRTVLEREGHRFRGGSDTEVLLAAVEHYGLRDALSRFNGMFAFALWDRRERMLSLARDRLGEKPLYYGWVNGTLLFGSELKALRAYPGFDAAVNRDAVSLFLRHNYIPAPFSIYHGIRKLPPASYLQYTAKTMDAAPQHYWSARSVVEHGTASYAHASPAELIDALETLLSDAVQLRMVADVPLGAFLSGGIDSSTVVALMQKASARPVRTFSIGYKEAFYNEANFAHAVARHLGTDHTEMYVSAAQAMGVIPRLAHMYDEPFADSSQIPTYLVSALAREHVTVSLSGDGGDELFGGYNRYTWGRRLWNRISWVPRPARDAVAGAIRRVPAYAWERVFNGLAHVTPTRLQQQMPVSKVFKLADFLSADSPEALYRLLVSHWKHPAAVLKGASEPLTTLSDPSQWPALEDFASWMMYLDMVTYLPDDILVKLDRASMSVGLEARVPLLDHRVVEFAWSVPQRFKHGRGGGKWLLRQVLARHVPNHLVDRPKMGFGVPIGAWLRKELLDWAEDLLDERRLANEGFFEPAPIRKIWSEHLSGKQNWEYNLWDVLMFQSWLENEKNAETEPLVRAG